MSLLKVNCISYQRAKFDDEDKLTPLEERKIVGDATETGLLRFASQHVPDIISHQANHGKVCEIPFSSNTKWHLTINKIEREDSHFTLFLKGAPERVVKLCSKFRMNDLDIPMNEEQVAKFNEAYEHFASQGQRVLAFAYMILPKKEFPENFVFDKDPRNFPSEGFTFLGLTSLMDPPKRGVRKAVAACRTAGIQVVMVTGDHPITAEAIGRKIGLISGETKQEVARRTKKPIETVNEDEFDVAIVHGDKIDSFSDQDWDSVLSKKEIIFARTSPRHKLMIVTKSQAKGHIVGVSGDGVNDSPALKKADLGISMNKTGSDVSKEAATMILLDDNFASIVVGIAEGRLIFENLKKSIRYTLTHLLPEIIPFLIFIIISLPLPISSLLILCIDLGTELGPALSFAYEPPETDLILMPPRKVLCAKVVGKDEEGRPCNPPPRSLLGKLIFQLKKPFKRNETGEVLVDNDLMLWSYFQGGLFETVGAFGAYLITFSIRRVPFSVLYKGASTYFKADAIDLVLTNGEIVKIY